MEFANAEAVGRARALYPKPTNEISVLALGRDTTLLRRLYGLASENGARFATNRRSSPTLSLASSPLRGHGPPQNPRKLRFSPARNNFIPREVKQEPVQEGAFPSSFVAIKSSSSLPPETSSSAKSSIEDALPLMLPAHIPSAPEECIPANVPSTAPADVTPTMTSISLHIHGKVCCIDLEALNEDPTPVISLLQQTNAGRDNWIMVAAHYRRKGLWQAAHTVATAMLEGTDSSLSLCRF